MSIDGSSGDDAVDAFLATVEPAERRADAVGLCAAMARASGERPAMWGSAIIGFGRFHYRHASGREGDMARLSFSPRKAQLVLYGLGGAARHPDLLARLGRHTTGKGCINIRRLADVDAAVLDALLVAGWADPVAG